MKYKKKPVVIDALQLTKESIKEVYEFIHDGKPVELTSQIAHDKWEVYESYVITDGMTIGTLEDGIDGRAKHVASIGDFIIKGIAGEFYPCKPDIFYMTYEIAE